MNLVFWTFTTFYLFFALLAITSSNIVYSVLSLILVFCNSAILLLNFNIEFISILLIIIYVGAIAVLFLFIVMMLNIKPGASFKFNKFFILLFFINCFFFFKFFSIIVDSNKEIGVLIQSYSNISLFLNQQQWINLVDPITNIETVGQILYVFYSPFFIIAGLILLIALIGTVMLTLKESPRQLVFKQMSRNFKNAFFNINSK